MTQDAQATRPGAERIEPAADDSSARNRLTGGPFDVHALLIDEAAEAFTQGEVDRTRVTADPAGVGLDSCDRVAPPRADSNRASTPRASSTPLFRSTTSCHPGTSMCPRLWLHRRAPRGAGEDDSWTPFYYLGQWGRVAKVKLKHLRDESGRIEVDYFRSMHSFDRLQYVSICTPSAWTAARCSGDSLWPAATRSATRNSRDAIAM